MVKPSDLPARRPSQPACSTPEKRCFRSKADARRAQRALRLPAGQKDHLHPYRCPCGQHWHLTHQTPEEQRQVTDRIAAAASAARGSLRHTSTSTGSSATIRQEQPQ